MIDDQIKTRKNRLSWYHIKTLKKNVIWCLVKIRWSLFLGKSSQALSKQNYFEIRKKVKSVTTNAQEIEISVDVYRNESRTKRKRSTWDSCSLKLYSRQYYQGKEIRFDKSHRRVPFRFYAKSIKTFGKCCWRIFW